MTHPSDTQLAALYGAGALDAQKRRYGALAEEYAARFYPARSLRFFSAPGRTELGGNHTDHNRGRVLAAAVTRDTIAAAEPRADSLVRMHSSAFPQLFEVDLRSLGPHAGEAGTSSALIRGVAEGLEREGFAAGGFNAVVAGDVPVGSGLSSSASFEVLVGGIFSALYNGGGVDPVTLAKIGQYAENVHFGKPCGLMDQLASAAGGVLAIDFRDPASPEVETIPFDFSRTGYTLAVVDTGGSHANLTPAYASIPADMKRVAALFGKTALREVGEEAFRAGMGPARAAAGDRAVLRALHFFAENRRVARMAAALVAGDFDAYLGLVAESGASSSAMLQNTAAPGDGREQPAALAIGVSNDFFRRRGRGVSRIHGGGFAGTIQAYIPGDCVEAYARLMEGLFGPGCVRPLAIRSGGVMAVV